MIAPGDVVPRRDTDLHVGVLSNAIHLAAGTGRVITCPFIPGAVADAAMAMVVAATAPDGTVLPGLVQWLPRSALDELIGNIGAAALGQTTTMVAALIS